LDSPSSSSFKTCFIFSLASSHFGSPPLPLSLSQRLTVKRKEAQCRSEFSEDQERNVVFKFWFSLSLSLSLSLRLFLSQELLLQKLWSLSRSSMSSKKSTRFNSEADNSSQSEEPKTDQKPRSRNKEKHSTTSRGRRKKQAQLLHRERQRQRLSLLLLHTQEGKKERKRQRKKNTTANLMRNGSKEAQPRQLQSPTLECMKRMQGRRREAIERSSEELGEKRKSALTRERQEWEPLTQWRTRGAL
jgi:hypothetical protein